MINGGTRLGAEKPMLQEWHYFFENTLRWRNLRKITIAQVHGNGLRGRPDADVGLRPDRGRRGHRPSPTWSAPGSGMCGVEYFAHPWEFGPRKTKELLLTGDSIDAEEAHRLGMVSKIFPADELAEQTLEFARRIAQLPTMAALLIKESVNQTQDNMGFYNALNACFTLHELNHSHWAEINENHYPVGTPEFGVVPWNQAPPVQPALKEKAEAGVG